MPRKRSNREPTTGIEPPKEKLAEEKYARTVLPLICFVIFTSSLFFYFLSLYRKESCRRVKSVGNNNKSIENGCEPWNREHFLERVSTYTNVKWFAKVSFNPSFHLSTIKKARTRTLLCFALFPFFFVELAKRIKCIKICSLWMGMFSSR